MLANFVWQCVSGVLYCDEAPEVLGIEGLLHVQVLPNLCMGTAHVYAIIVLASLP